MTQPSSLLIVDSDLHGLEMLTYGFEREGCKVTRTSDLSRAVQLSRTSSPALATVMLREPATTALEVIAALRGAHRAMPILVLGDAALQTQARAAGASDYLCTPTFIRDVVNAAKLDAYGADGEGLLSEFHGLFYLLRAMQATARSCVLRLARGSQRAEIRFKDGKVVSANVRALQHLPALHHVLLWEEAGVSIASGPVTKPSQFPLSAQEILDESERFLRDFAHAARDLGPPSTIYQPVPEPRPIVTGMQPSQMVPLLRLFDGKHGLADVVEESPFRIFDTIRMIRRLVEGGVLTTHTNNRRPTGPQRRITQPVAPLNGGAPQSMLGQWAMVPDQRGVVGDRRSPSRPLLPFGNFDQPGRGGDRRRPSRPLNPIQVPLAARQVAPAQTPGPTPLPTPAPAPIPLVNKKVSSGEIAVKGELGEVPGEIPAVKRRPTPGPLTSMALEPTVQVKVDTDGTPLELPPARPHVEPEPPPELFAVRPHIEAEAPLELPPVRPQFEAEPGPELPPVRMDDAPPPAPAPEPEPPPAVREPPPAAGRLKTPAPGLITPAPIARKGKTPIPGRVTPAAAFDAVEADFFAREADLYKREAVETFDDLDSSGGDARSKSRRKRK
jgi:DNA-binding response OmpR family regulator